MNIILCGFMGCGKSTIGKYLALKTGRDFIDLDEFIENEKNMSITEIFESFGESEFRNFETQAIKKLSKKENHIIALGGGAILKEENIGYLKSSGKIVFLEVSPLTAFERTKNDDKRPLLQVDNLLEVINDMMSKRKQYYEKAADFKIDANDKDIEKIAEEILNLF